MQIKIKFKAVLSVHPFVVYLVSNTLEDLKTWLHLCLVKADYDNIFRYRPIDLRRLQRNQTLVNGLKMEVVGLPLQRSRLSCLNHPTESHTEFVTLARPIKDRIIPQAADWHCHGHNSRRGFLPHCSSFFYVTDPESAALYLNFKPRNVSTLVHFLAF